MRSRHPSHDPTSRTTVRIFTVFLAFLVPMGMALSFLWPALSGGLLADDYLVNIFLDRDVATHAVVDWSRVWRDLSGPWLGLEGSAIYRPMISLQYGIEIALGQGDPVYLHVSNAIVHVLTVFAVCWLGFALSSTAPARTAFVAGTLFALHPACMETAAWISGCVTGTQVLFSMLAVASFAWARRRSRVEWLAFSWVAALLALLSKESALMLPLLLLLVDGLVRLPTTWTGTLGRHLLFAPLWIAYLAARKLFLGTFLGEGLAGWEPEGLTGGWEAVLANLEAKLTALAMPYSDLFTSWRGLWVPSPRVLVSRLGHPTDLVPFLEVLAFLAFLGLVVFIALRSVRNWRILWTVLLGTLAVLATFAPTYAFPIGRDLGGMRHLYEGAAWACIVVALAAFDVRAVPRRLATWCVLVLLAVWGTGLALQTHARGTRYAWAWDEVAHVERALQTLGEEATPEKPLVSVVTPTVYEGVPLVRPNAVYAMGEPPNAPHDVPVVGLNCTFESVLHSEPLYHDAAPLRAMMEFGGTLLFWDPAKRAFVEVGRDPAIDGLPAVTPLGGGRTVFRFAELLGPAYQNLSPFWIERVDVAVSGEASGGQLAWSVGGASPASDAFVVFGEGTKVGEGGERITHFSVDLSHSLTFFSTQIQGGVSGFTLTFDEPVDPARVIALQLAKRLDVLPAMGTPLRGNGLHVGEESVLLHPPRGPVPEGQRRSLVLMGQHAALLVPIEGNVVRFDEVVARDLRRIARMMRTPRVWYYFLEEPVAGQAFPARRSVVDWFTLLPPE